MEFAPLRVKAVIDETLNFECWLDLAIDELLAMAPEVSFS